MIFTPILLIIVATELHYATGSPHHDEIPHPHVELFNNHIYRIKGLLFGTLGMLSVIIAAFVVYQLFVKKIRGERSTTLFSERGSLLPTTVDQTLFSRARFASLWPIKNLRDYHEHFTMGPQSQPVSVMYYNERNVKSKAHYDPWENL